MCHDRVLSLKFHVLSSVAKCAENSKQKYRCYNANHQQAYHQIEMIPPRIFVIVKIRQSFVLNKFYRRLQPRSFIDGDAF